MLNFLNDKLLKFKRYFKNINTFKWFVLIVVGFMIRPDLLGITSIVRAFGLGSLAYKGLRDFFRSRAYDPTDIQNGWSHILAKSVDPFKINNRTILVGDGTNRTTEGKYMAGQTRMSSSSSTQSKPATYIGQFYGCVSVLAGKADKVMGIPLFFSLQKGIKMLSFWKGKNYFSHIETVLLDGLKAASDFGPSYLVLDRFFLSKELIKRWRESEYKDLLDVVVRLKKDTVAYKDPIMPPPGKRGPKPVKGAKVKLAKLFEKTELFTTARLSLYGKKELVSYYTLNLKWGQGLYHKLRFVLATYNNRRIILATTDLTMKPEDALVAYSYRFKIEHTFKIYKHVFGGMFSHFWTKSLGKKATLFRSSDQLMEMIKDPDDQKKIIKTVQAFNTYVTCTEIAMGLTQLLCLKSTEIDQKKLPYQRTFNNSILSERQMKTYLQMNLSELINSQTDLAVSEIIREKKSKYQDHDSWFTENVQSKIA